LFCLYKPPIRLNATTNEHKSEPDSDDASLPYNKNFFILIGKSCQRKVEMSHVVQSRNVLFVVSLSLGGKNEGTLRYEQKGTGTDASFGRGKEETSEF
jgi:hypothetical protein